MQSRDRWLYLPIIVVLGFLCTYLGWEWKEAARQRSSDIAVLQFDKSRLEAEVARLQTDLTKAQSLPFLVLPDPVINQMKEKGLKDPVADLVSDLKARTDLIPFQPLGGGETRVTPWVITSNWVVAIADDGHRAIKAFLSYDIKDGEITWTLTAAEPDLLLLEQQGN